MCKHFILPNTSKECVMVLITFSMELDKQIQMNQVKWYTTEFLINFMVVENLKNVNFNPTPLEMETDYRQLIWLPIVCSFTSVGLYKKPTPSIFRLFI